MNKFFPLSDSPDFPEIILKKKRVAILKQFIKYTIMRLYSNNSKLYYLNINE
jgi:hypothetical protein